MIKLALAELVPAEKLPEDLKKFSEGYATQRRIAQLEAQLAQREQVQKHQEYFNSIASGAREYVSKSVGESTPTLAVVAKANPDRAHREIMEEISRDAQSRAASDPNGEPMTYQEAAKRVEARLAEWKSLLVQNGDTATTQAKKPVDKLPPQPKPPGKPIQPWQKKDDLAEAGLQDAIREFHRMEAARKRH
jgi:hypothetical protein